MGLVAAALAVALAGCYDPTLKDCTVSCASDADCAHGQACAAGFCAAATATCSAFVTPLDAAVDARMIDAQLIDAPPPDARTDATLRITVKNKGEVVVPGFGTCNNDDQNKMVVCTFGVYAGAKLTATATATSGGHMFSKWTDPVCKSQGASCMFTVLPLTNLQAEFQ